MAESFEYLITRLAIPEDGVAVLTLDDPSSSANVMNAQLQQELYGRVEQLEQQAEKIKGLLIETAKPRIFIAGADIKYIANTSHFSHDQIVHFCEYGQRLYDRFASLPFPTVAVIQGACVGGGLEFALAMDWRIAADAATTLIGLPEVQLGLVPGWAATARVPRLCSVETGMRRIGSGENFNAETALQIGIVDQLAPPDQIQQVAKQTLLQLPQEQWQNRRDKLTGTATRLLEANTENSSAPELTQSDIDTLAEAVLRDIEAANPSLHKKAPTTVVDLIRRSALEPYRQAAALEAEAMTTVYTSDSGQGLVNAFLLNDRAKKSPGIPAKPDSLPVIRTVGVVGLGVMGRSIAKLLAKSDWKFLLFDQNPEQRSLAAAQFASHDNVTICDSIEELKDVDVVSENVFERLDIKRHVLKELEQIVRPDTFLLTNTSGIPISSMEDVLEDSSRFAGLHFFNPIKETRLAEIARHNTTSAPTQWAAYALARQARKMSIFVGDGPGLVVNRLLMAMLNEAQHLLAEGYEIPEIDQAAVDFGWRLGPFQIMDTIGLQTTFDAGRQMSSQLPEAVDAPPFVLPLIRAGYTGLPNGDGFYHYKDAQRIWNPEIMQKIQHYIRPSGEHRLDRPALADRLAAAMVWQACEVLDRGQVNQAADIDLCTVLGLGFPPFRGGLLFWADHKPLAKLVEAFQQHRPKANLPSAAQKFLESNLKFYSTTFPLSS